MARSLPRGWGFFLILGFFLTLRGYHSRDGDQAYRLPLLLRQQDPSLFEHDPFVRAFDAFNPHRGYLKLLEVASLPLGLSAGLALLFVATFALTWLGLTRLARACWPEYGGAAAVLTVVLVLAAKAGNIGTNHLFEAMLLDRLIGFALGWVALAFAVARPSRGWWASPLALGTAALVHPSVGLQLGLILGGSWVVWACLSRRAGVDWKTALFALPTLGVALIPGVLLNLGSQERLLSGLPLDEFRLLSLEVQGPQHMLPHLWRFPQWIAWACFPALGLLSLRWTEAAEVEAAEDTIDPSKARFRLGVTLVVTLVGLGMAWVGVEVLQDLRITLFQPFRMATVFRGLVLVALSGRLLTLWRSGSYLDRCRAMLLGVGLVGDRAFVVATLFDVLIEALDRVGVANRTRVVAAGMFLVVALRFLSRHDTESGHIPLLAGLVCLVLVTLVQRRWTPAWNRRRVAFALVTAWFVPVAALVAGALGDTKSALVCGLVERCRFGEVATDDVERLAVWCRENTPESARFIGPPGPKTFRLWSRRSLAFNRAASPYHAAGLADWSARFRDHVGFDGSTTEFVRAYQVDRHGLEKRYQGMGDVERARLALREGADHVISAAPAHGEDVAREGPLELLHVEGRYAVYRVRQDEALANRDKSDRRN
ncbi:DUF6798 domain-containing protein [Singulisphaera sp. PoT]|uniref:DUF6798 domain-containing protein n=1 Tax=Singulisphaera sp. PoT TaxID=3411797 RepID=UPI003BF53A78